uniref:Uncharacterized protein n=1 Tax=Parascaris equorum TaxID=6256 RepID=A0A914RR64_PAREQ
MTWAARRYNHLESYAVNAYENSDIITCRFIN